MKKQTKPNPLVQIPFRCSIEFLERIIRALGVSMSRSGKKISKNDLLIHLLELGLDQEDSNR